VRVGPDLADAVSERDATGVDPVPRVRAAMAVKSVPPIGSGAFKLAQLRGRQRKATSGVTLVSTVVLFVTLLVQLADLTPG